MLMGMFCTMVVIFVQNRFLTPSLNSPLCQVQLYEIFTVQFHWLSNICLFRTFSYGIILFQIGIFFEFLLVLCVSLQVTEEIVVFILKTWQTTIFVFFDFNLTGLTIELRKMKLSKVTHTQFDFLIPDFIYGHRMFLSAVSTVHPSPECVCLCTAYLLYIWTLYNQSLVCVCVCYIFIYIRYKPYKKEPLGIVKNSISQQISALAE